MKKESPEKKSVNSWFQICFLKRTFKVNVVAIIFDTACVDCCDRTIRLGRFPGFLSANSRSNTI